MLPFIFSHLDIQTRSLLGPASEGTDELDILATAKLPQLKAMCKERGLKVTGTKAVLIERLKEDFSKVPTEGPSSEIVPITDTLSKMTVVDLRDALVARGLAKHGKKQELVERLQADIQMTKDVSEIYRPNGQESSIAVSQIMEEVAKKGTAFEEFLAEKKAGSAAVRKFVDVTITSLGLVPDKYTVGGAPSVTADVLRKLAGDPYADPPKYGKVRYQILNWRTIIDEHLTLFDYFRRMTSLAKKGARLSTVFAPLGRSTQ
jgi:SAP domain